MEKSDFVDKVIRFLIIIVFLELTIAQSILAQMEFVSDATPFIILFHKENAFL